MQTAASFKTERAGRYLKALCHHFGRKVEAECDETKGWVQFPFGRCEMVADESALNFRAFADDQRQLAQVTRIITGHLERFAFREDPKLTWDAQIATTDLP